ncbi:MAG: hypothetical protein N2C12_05040, partial [Planctomycetales bacterium]
NGIDDDPAIKDKYKEEFKVAVGQLIDVGFDTLKAEKFEAGMALIAGKKPTLVLGGSVADGTALEESVQKIYKIASNVQKTVPEVKWEAENHGFYKIHVMSIPTSDEGGDKSVIGSLVGGKMQIAMAVNKNSCYLAFGGDSVAELKKTIDAAESKMSEDVPPVEAVVRLSPFLKAVAPLNQTMAMMAQMTPENSDIRFTAESVPGGVRARVMLKKEALSAISQLATMVMMGFGGGPGGPGGPGGF